MAYRGGIVKGRQNRGQPGPGVKTGARFPGEAKLAEEGQAKLIQKAILLKHDLRYKEIEHYKEGTNCERLHRIVDDERPWGRPPPPPGSARGSRFGASSSAVPAPPLDSCPVLQEGARPSGSSRAPAAARSKNSKDGEEHEEDAEPRSCHAEGEGDPEFTALAHSECRGFQQMSAERFSGRVHWEESFRSKVKDLMLDFKLSNEPTYALNHLDRFHNWFLSEGKKQVRKEKPSPNFITYHKDDKVLPGSTRDYTPVFDSATLNLASRMSMRKSPRLIEQLHVVPPPPPPPGYK